MSRDALSKFTRSTLCPRSDQSISRRSAFASVIACVAAPGRSSARSRPAFLVRRLTRSLDVMRGLARRSSIRARTSAWLHRRSSFVVQNPWKSDLDRKNSSSSLNAHRSGAFIRSRSSCTRPSTHSRRCSRCCTRTSRPTLRRSSTSASRASSASDIPPPPTPTESTVSSAPRPLPSRAATIARHGSPPAPCREARTTTRPGASRTSSSASTLARTSCERPTQMNNPPRGLACTARTTRRTLRSYGTGSASGISGIAEEFAQQPALDLVGVVEADADTTPVLPQQLVNVLP